MAGSTKSHLDQTRFTDLANSMPNATIRTVEAGHRIHSRQPDRWSAEVESYLLAFKSA